MHAAGQGCHNLILPLFNLQGLLRYPVPGDPNLDDKGTDKPVEREGGPISVTNVVNKADGVGSGYSGQLGMGGGGYDFDLQATVVIEVGPIDGVEVTQAIQEYQPLEQLRATLEANKEPPIPIIAQKPAVVRVYLKPVDRVTKFDVEVSSPATGTEKRRISYDPGCTTEKQRKWVPGCKSADFYGLPPEGSWDLTVRVFEAGGQNPLQEEKLSFRSRTARPLILNVARVCDSEACADTSHFKSDISLLEKLAPTDRVVVIARGSLYVEGKTGSSGKCTNAAFPTERPVVPENFVVRATDRFVLNYFVDWIAGGPNRVANEPNGYPAYFGLIRPNPAVCDGLDGLTKRGTPFSVLRTSALRFKEKQDIERQTIAHEFGHEFALKEFPSSTEINQDGPEPACWLAQDPSQLDLRVKSGLLVNRSTNQLEVGFDVDVPKPVLASRDRVYDVMTYCEPRWISPFTYMTELERIAPKGGADAATGLMEQQDTMGDFWAVSGTIQTDGVSFNPLSQETLTVTPDTGSGPYRIEVQSASGAVLYTQRFTPLVFDNATLEPTGSGFFIFVPVTAGAAKLLAFDLNNRQIGSLSFGGAAPSATLTLPVSGTILSGTQNIAWSIADPDSNEFTTRLLYSGNNGQTWLQLGETKGTVGSNSFAFDFDELPGGLDSALISLWVSDGVNSGQVVSKPFTVLKKTNVTADIVAPEPNSISRKDDPVTFRMGAYDVDDGFLDGAAIRWESSLDGPVGNGARLRVTTLRPGEHKITATATDSDGNQASKTVDIVVAGDGPTINLTIRGSQAAPTTCAEVSIQAAAGSVPITTLEYSLDRGTTWTSVPIAQTPFNFTLPGSGSFYVLAHAIDAANQVASQEAQFSTTGPCQSLTPPAGGGSASFVISNRGGTSLSSVGGAGATTVGYGRIHPNTGSTAPSGLAIFGFRQNGVLVTEAAVPASPAVTSGRIYAEVGGAVNTGLAIANPNAQAAHISFYFSDATRTSFNAGTVTVDANGQTAAFLDQAPFNGGTSINGTLTFSSDVPVAVIALRGLTNERNEFLLTTLPVSALSTTTGETIYFPQFADGGGWSSQLILVNPTDDTITGTVNFFGQGSPGESATSVRVTIDGQTDTSFSYSIPPRSSKKLRTSGSDPLVRVGSVRVIPAAGNKTPIGVAVFSFRNNRVTVSEAGVPATRPATAWRLYAEVSGGSAQIQTGFAITNSSSTDVTVNVELTTLAGASTGLSGSVVIPGNGQISSLLSQISGFSNIPTPFKGVLRISTSATTGISVVGLRTRSNERRDFLITTTSPSNEGDAAATSELYFPHLADSGGYTTQFILFSGSANQTASGSIQLFTQSGQPLNLTLQ